MAAVHNLTIDQGSPFVQPFLIKNPDNSNKDLSGFTARMQFRVSVGNGYVYMDATTLNGKLLIDVPSSTVTINLSDEDTAGLYYSNYVYDIEIVDALGEPTRITQGNVFISSEVTR